ncbi:MAG TPA: amino acid ABC transporter substrate-binding protein [Dyella sp.]|uniref:amino acid ABC transporter substrate-binding protein n=1 Tax=Dyella sp. TaxID=1869338 RepID=UPI002D795BB5|nr:amino acid ABC transporter substrate-binding protein [Dyella sp.]HET6553745.1 amino acid ABC transporter substrate-binding protein [Dyella sp.]
MSSMKGVAMRNRLFCWVLLVVFFSPVSAALAQEQQPAGASTLERIRASGKVTFGFYNEAHPFTYQEASAPPDGYAIALCRAVASAVQQELKLPNLSTQFVAVDSETRFSAVKEGRVDLLCGPSVPTMSNREQVSFSIPILGSGTGVMVRKDAPAAFRELLETGQTAGRPVWRGSPMLAALQQRTFAVISGSLQERLLKERREQLNVNSVISLVPDLATGLKQLQEGRADAFIAERNVLLDLAKRDTSGELVVLNRVFDYEPLAFAVSRNDADFRLLVDRTLSQLYRSGKIDAIYEQYLGKPDQSAKDWFRKAAVPE